MNYTIELLTKRRDFYRKALALAMQNNHQYKYSIYRNRINELDNAIEMIDKYNTKKVSA